LFTNAKRRSSIRSLKDGGNLRIARTQG
jgi:hypothetical protein